eukprot:GHVP01061983.1.p1 GENE.GHVP01061983.1~~GHVP01061983.1.p1  ORF type:complete len:256 (+),score=37.61 GHVP01061983.1:495-1262(+)
MLFVLFTLPVVLGLSYKFKSKLGTLSAVFAIFASLWKLLPHHRSKKEEKKPLVEPGPESEASEMEEEVDVSPELWNLKRQSFIANASILAYKEKLSQVNKRMKTKRLRAIFCPTYNEFGGREILVRMCECEEIINSELATLHYYQRNRPLLYPLSSLEINRGDFFSGKQQPKIHSFWTPHAEGSFVMRCGGLIGSPQAEKDMGHQGLQISLRCKFFSNIPFDDLYFGFLVSTPGTKLSFLRYFMVILMQFLIILW